MIFWLIVFVLAIISVLWALWSLRGFKKHVESSKHVSEKLSRERVLFQEDQPVSYLSESDIKE